MPAIMYVKGNLIVCDDRNYQGFTYDTEKNICMPTKQRTIVKWEVLKDVFPKLVKGRTHMDIGASFGFYCFKALECGAIKSTAIESKKSRRKLIKRILEEGSVENLEWIRTKWPCGGVADVVTMLAVIHRLSLQQGMLLQDILDALAGNVGQYALVEWIFVEKGWAQHRKLKIPKDYRVDEFERLARQRFGSVGVVKAEYREAKSIYLLEK